MHPLSIVHGANYSLICGSWYSTLERWGEGGKKGQRGEREGDRGGSRRDKRRESCNIAFNYIGREGNEEHQLTLMSCMIFSCFAILSKSFLFEYLICSSFSSGCRWDVTSDTSTTGSASTRKTKSFSYVF